MSRIFLFLGIVLFSILAMSQEITQTVRGTIHDTDSKLPLAGVQVLITGSHPLKGTATYRNGEFRLEQVPPGRIALQVSYIGYETRVIPGLIITSGKEVYMNLEMQESILADE